MHIAQLREEVCLMGLNSLNPLTVDQVLRGLAALGREVVADPEHRPEGPTQQDLPELLGGLLALVEYEVAAVVDTDEEPPAQLTELQDGWRSESEDLAVHRAVLVHRLQRTAYDIGAFLGGGLDGDDGLDAAFVAELDSGRRADSVDDEDEDEDLDAEPPGLAGASACAFAAANLVQAQDLSDAGHTEEAHLALDAAEGTLAQALLTVHLLRLRLRSRGE